ncbi:MAG: transketolase [Flavobacteriaceae bacterium]|jgi:transketolase
MINKDLHLVEDIFNTESLEKVPTRNGFGEGLLEAGRLDERVVALCADLSESTRMHHFQNEFPERYVEIGVAEQNLAVVASGMANYGKIPFISSYAAFSPGRNNEQIRTTISLANLPVKIAGSHAGLSVGPDGATHQALEDIGLMRMQPNMIVLAPSDALEAKKATLAAAQIDSPVYIRLARDKSPVYTTEKTPFEIGKAYVYYESEKPLVALFACGALLHNTLLAAEILEEKGIGSIVVNVPTIKPLDTETIEMVAEKVEGIVTVEEHQVAGGMGSAIAEHLVQIHPLPMRFIGIHDRFGQSGTTPELYEEYGLTPEDISKAGESLAHEKV